MNATTIRNGLRSKPGLAWGCARVVVRAAWHAHVPVPALARPLARGLYGVHVVVRESLAWLLRFFWFEPLFRGQCASVGSGLRIERLPYLQGHGRVHLGRSVRLSGKQTIAFGRVLTDCPELVVGDGTFIGHDCTFHIASRLRIGARCLLATGVWVADFDGHPVDAAARRRGDATPESAVAAVTIEDDVWIGTGAYILKGVTVGQGAIIGAGAMVTRDVDPFVVVAGNPARVVRGRTTQPDPAE